MSQPRNHVDEESLVQRLDEYDVLLAEESAGEFSDSSLVESDADLTVEWRQAKSCLDLLHRIRAEVQETEPKSRTDTDWLRVDTTKAGSAKLPGLPDIGRFSILRELGRGGLGVVFLAEDTKLRRQVALKVPQLGAMLDTDLEQRFVREAEAAARLNHPSIVRVFEVGREGPLCYIASEYCSGLTLRAWLAERSDPVSEQEASQLVLQLAQAVEHAHRRGVLHRDIKPANVMLEPVATASNHSEHFAAEDCIPRLTDFGMAKLMEAEGDATHSGMRIGTLNYMSPEQVEGRVGDIDERTDVYALGVLLYEMLAGSPPFVGTTPTETAYNIGTKEPVGLSQIRPSLAKDLEAVCLKCLEKEPDHRYESAAALADDLQRWLQGKPTLARPVGPFSRALKYCRRHPGTAALMALATTALLVLLVGGWLFGEQMRRAAVQERSLRQIATTNMRLARENELKALDQKRKADGLLGIAKMRLAHEAWKNDKIHAFTSLLTECDGLFDSENQPAFVWNYLRRLRHLEDVSFRDEHGHKYAVAFLDDDQLLTGDMSGRLKIRSRATGTEVQELTGHASCVNSVALSPDGKLVASASCDETIRIFDRRDWSKQKELRSQHGAVGVVRFLDDSKSLVSIGLNHTVTYWDVEQGREIETIAAKDNVACAAVGMNGDLFIKALVDGRVEWRRLSTGEAPQQARLSEIRALAVDHTGTWIAAGSHGGSIWLWREEDKPSDIAIQTPSGVSRLAFSHSDETLAVAGNDGIIRLYDLDKRTLVESFKGHDSRINDLTFSPNDREIATASDDYHVKVWRRGSEKDFSSIELPPDDAEVVALAPNGETFAYGLSDGSVNVFRVDDPSRALFQCSHEEGATISNCIFSQDGRTFTAFWEDGQLAAWKLDKRKPQLLADHTRNANMDFDVCGTSHRIARVGRHGRELVLETIDSKNAVRSFEFRHLISKAKFSPDGRYLAVGTQGESYLINLSNDSSQQLPMGWTNELVFSRDGRLITALNGDKLIVCSTDDLDVVSIIRGELDRIRAMAIAPDGKSLATGSGDKIVRLWHLPTGQQMLALEGHEHEVTAVAFNDDGSKLYSLSSEDGEPRSLICWSTR